MIKLARMMTIGAFGKACGVPTPTIRYYERIKLLPEAERSPSGQRLYRQDDLERLTFIRRCRDFGYSIKQVRALVDLSNSATMDCRAYRDIAQERIGEIGLKIQELLALETTLQALVAKCETSCIGGAGRDCAALVATDPVVLPKTS